MGKRTYGSWRFLLAMTPATLISAAAMALVALLVVLPAVSSFDFLNAERSVPGTDAGDLLVIDRSRDDGVAVGDVVVVATLPEGESVIYAVSAIDAGFAVLSQSIDGPALTLPRAELRIRATRTIPHLGDAYDFVDSVPGWVTVIGSVALAWIGTLGLRSWRRSRGPHAAVNAAAPPAAPMLADMPALQHQHPDGAGAPGIAVRNGNVARRSDANSPPAVAELRVAHTLDLIGRDVARPAPQHRVAVDRGRAAFRPAEETVRWAGLGAVAAIVAAATLLVAEESHHRQRRRR